MSTSANVTYYQVFNKSGNLVKEHSQHCLCKPKVKEELAVYQLSEDYTIILRHPDEDEADHYTLKMSLKDFLNGKKAVWED
jgi:hypothetical protein